MALTVATNPFLNENTMISTNTSSRSYEREMYERDMHYRRQEEEYRRRKEEEYRRMQSWAITSAGPAPNETPKADPNDPLAFLKKADSKLLLTGEPS